MTTDNYLKAIRLTGNKPEVLYAPFCSRDEWSYKRALGLIYSFVAGIAAEKVQLSVWSHATASPGGFMPIQRFSQIRGDYAPTPNPKDTKESH